MQFLIVKAENSCRCVKSKNVQFFNSEKGLDKPKQRTYLLKSSIKEGSR